MFKELVLIGMVIAPTEEVDCLSKNMYYEARSEGLAGMLAVTAVVLNRVEDKRFPNDVCGVVYQGPTTKSIRTPSVKYPIKNKCQFSWYCDGKSDTPLDIKSFAFARGLAYEILKGTFSYVDITEGALFYHAKSVKPSWSKVFKKTVEINEHKFYSWD